MDSDAFGDSVTVQFVGGPYDGEDVVQGNIPPAIYPRGYLGRYRWHDGQYHWEAQL